MIVKFLNALKKRKINLTDCLCEKSKIDLLIGVDITGKLLIENVVDVDSDLTAVESKLGWMVIGKQNLCIKDRCTTSLSMYVRTIPLNELRALEVLIILDATELLVKTMIYMIIVRK